MPTIGGGDDLSGSAVQTKGFGCWTNFYLGNCQCLYEGLGNYLAALPNRSQYRGYLLEMMPNESAGVVISDLCRLAGNGGRFHQPERALHSYSGCVCSDNKVWLSRYWNRFHV